MPRREPKRRWCQTCRVWWKAIRRRQWCCVCHELLTDQQPAPTAGELAPQPLDARAHAGDGDGARAELLPLFTLERAG